MKSRTSYFSKTIFRKNILHFWPIWVVYTLFLTIMMPVRIFVTIANTVNIQSEIDIKAQKIEQFVYAMEDSVMPLWIFLMALVCAMALFYYMYSSRSCHMFHALPVNRTQLYVTNYVSGLLFMIIPQIFTFVISAFICAMNDITDLEYLLYWLLMSMGMSIFAFSMAVAIGMITGQLIMIPVFFAIANFLYMGIRFIFGLLMMQLTYGLQESYSLGKSSMLSPFYYLGRKVSFYIDWNEMDDCIIRVTGGKAIAIYAVLGIVLAVVGLVIYRKRRLETVGDFLTINWLKPVFRWGSTIVLSVAAAVIITGVVRDSFRSSSLLPILVGVVIVGVIIFFIAQMFVEKKFRVFSKKRGLECLCIQVLLVIGLLGISLDVLGLESRMPKASEVKAVYLNLDYPLKMESEQEIEEAMELHQQILDSRAEFQEVYYGGDTVNSQILGIKYYLKDGTTIERHYDIPTSEKYLEDQESVIAQMLEKENCYENYMASLFGRNYEGTKPMSVSVELYNQTMQTYEPVNMPSDLTEVFFEALQEDIREGNLRYGPNLEYENASVYSTMTIEFYNADGIQDISDEWFGIEEDARGNWKSSETSISFTEDCVHILEVLEQSGLVSEPYCFTSYQEWLEM